MAKDGKISAAFHEVMHNTPKAVKHTAKKFGAKRAHKQEIAIALSKARAAGADVPNYVSRDELHMPPGASSGVCHAGERVPYKADAAGDFDDVILVSVQQGGPEKARQRNNRTRDARTNLGKGKAGIVEIGE